MTLYTLKHAWQCSIQCDLKLVCHKFQYRIRPGDPSWKQKVKILTKTLRYFLFFFVIGLGKLEIAIASSSLQLCFKHQRLFFKNCFCYLCDLCNFYHTLFQNTVFKCQFSFLMSTWTLSSQKRSNTFLCGFYLLTITLLPDSLYSELLHMK